MVLIHRFFGLKLAHASSVAILKFAICLRDLYVSLGLGYLVAVEAIFDFNRPSKEYGQKIGIGGFWMMAHMDGEGFISAALGEGCGKSCPH